MATSALGSLAQGINNLLSTKGNKRFTFPSVSSSTTAEAIQTSSQSAAVVKNPSAPSTPVSQIKVTSSPKTKSPSSTSVSSPSSVYPGPFTPRDSLVEFARNLLSPSSKPAVSPSSIYPGPFTPRESLVKFVKTNYPDSALSIEKPIPSIASPYASYPTTDSGQSSSTAATSSIGEHMEIESIQSSPTQSSVSDSEIPYGSVTFIPIDFSKDQGPFADYDPSATRSISTRRKTVMTSIFVPPANSYPLLSPTKDSYLSSYISFFMAKPKLSVDTDSDIQSGGMKSGHHTSYHSPDHGPQSGPPGRWHHFSPNPTPKSK